MKKYKNYIIGAGILILGIVLGNVFSGGSDSSKTADTEVEQKTKKLPWMNFLI